MQTTFTHANSGLPGQNNLIPFLNLALSSSPTNSRMEKQSNHYDWSQKSMGWARAREHTWVKQWFENLSQAFMIRSLVI